MSQPNNNNATAPKLPSTSTPKLPIPPTTRTKKHIGGLKNIIHNNIMKRMYSSVGFRNSNIRYFKNI